HELTCSSRKYNLIISLLVLYNVILHPHIFFFFQAEDGIRDATVTGVQTCALPIYSSNFLRAEFAGELFRKGQLLDATRYYVILRSEERRVGKECSSRWSRYD